MLLSIVKSHDAGSHPQSSLVLIEQSRAGSKQALEELLQRHLPGMQAFVRLRFNPALQARESSADLVQSVCADILADLDHFEYRGEAEFRSWLYTAVLNKIRKKYRFHLAAKRDLRREEVLASREEVLLQNSFAAFCSPSHQAIAREQVELLERAFEKLPDHYREVLSLSRIAGLSQEETAEAMGRTVPSTRNLLNRALVRLGGLMSEAQKGGGAE